MITDKLLRVSEDQTLALSGTTAVSTNTIDLSVNRDIGEGQGLFFNFALTAAVSAGTSVDFQVIVSDNADLSSPTVVAASGAVAQASLTAGKNIAVTIPPQIGSKGKRYLGTQYVVVGNNSAGTGAVTTDVVLSVQDGKKTYPVGYAVL